MTITADALTIARRGGTLLVMLPLSACPAATVEVLAVQLKVIFDSRFAVYGAGPV